MDANGWAAVASAIAAIAAVIGLYFSKCSLEQNTRAMELQVLESTFKDIRDLDREYVEHWPKWEPSQQAAWSATYFNTLEYVCYIVNRGTTNNKELEEFFFTDALPWWGRLFDEHKEARIISDTAFPELTSALSRRRF